MQWQEHHKDSQVLHSQIPNKTTKAIGDKREIIKRRRNMKFLQDLDLEDSITKRGFWLVDCRYRSPLSFFSNRCKNHGGLDQIASSKKVNNGGKTRSNGWKTLGNKTPLRACLVTKIELSRVANPS
jgi:hypothetical protein